MEVQFTTTNKEEDQSKEANPKLLPLQTFKHGLDCRVKYTAGDRNPFEKF